MLDTSLATLMNLSAQRGLRVEPLNPQPAPRSWFATVQACAEPQRGVQVPAGAQSETTRATLECLQSSDPVMTRNVETLRRVVDRDISVLLLGETGTGKGYCARAIHFASRRAPRPFVTVNCAAMPEGLMESELFGAPAGAFPGATREGGRLLEANGGTLFLDEIGDLPLGLQARLLNVIEEREVVPLGATRVVKLDVRIVSATQRDLLEMIARGRFREDLYYRLNGITVRLPPLRQRTDQIELITKLVQQEAEGPVEIESGGAGTAELWRVARQHPAAAKHPAHHAGAAQWRTPERHRPQGGVARGRRRH